MKTVRLGTYKNQVIGSCKNTNVILETTESTFLILSASFSSTSRCFSSGINSKVTLLFSLRLHVCVIVNVVVLIHEKENWQCPPSVTPLSTVL